ncbi:MAG: STAS domain-containing protein [Actinobacteria bacterium]|nr:STAS domain-containing protein [Actinomycetota bacterium]
MQHVPSSPVTVNWADGVATVAVRGELDAAGYSQVREQIVAMAANGPQRLVLDLADVSDSRGAECLALIAVVRHLLPPGCVLDVCSASPAVRRTLRLAGWEGTGPMTADQETESGEAG